MLFSKSVIFNKDWMDVVFAERNKAYGAYQLRLFGEKAIQLSLGGVILIVGGLCCLSFMGRGEIATLSSKSTIGDVITVVEIESNELVQEKIIVPEESKGEAQQVAQDVPAVDLVKFTEINPTDKVTSSDDVVETSEALAPKKMIAAISMKGQKGGELIPKGTFGKSKREGGIMGRATGDPNGGTLNADDPLDYVEIMPMPIGGMSAFVKWVGENYQFPNSAIDNEVAGLVQVSFVVERDGSLSSFEVKRDLGFGTGDQAIKLLKKAKKWNPGIQNGIPVRVAYTLPIRLNTLQQ